MKTLSLILLVALAACGGGDQPPAKPADSTAAPQAPVLPAPEPAPVDSSAPAPPEAGSAPATEPLPTRADSQAAAREDVSPEWKMRERSMASYAQCMEQAKAVEGAARANIERACANLPTAPR